MSTRRKLLHCGEGLGLKSAVPPEKPPRGFPRNGPVRIEPLGSLANQEKTTQLPKSPALSLCRFSTTEKYTNMKKYFREMVQKRDGGEFSGYDAVNILDDYLEMNREQFSANIVRRQNSVKVLDMWLRENVIRPVQASHRDSPPPFCDSKKSFYTMNPDSDHKLYICSTPTTYNMSVGRRPSRTSSFKRFFSPSRSRHAENMIVRSPSAASAPTITTRELPYKHTTPKSSTFTARARPSPSSTNSRSLEEEAMLHDAALFRLLTIVEIPMLDDLTTAPGQATKSASILSTILSKIGLGGTTPETIPTKEEEMDNLLENTPSIRPLVPWFQLARICAPGLYFKSSGQKPKREEIHYWAKASLQAVSNRYSSITCRGSSPLIPTEFSPIIEAIIEQLLGKKKKKTRLALQYLCLMIPQRLRKHLCNAVQFLERTIGTDQYMSLRDPFFLGKKEDTENFEIVLDELRLYIFTQKIERRDQNRLIEALLELRKADSLGSEPIEIIEDMKRMSENADNAVVPVRFCEAESSTNKFDADAEVAHALVAIIDSTGLSLAEKQKKCELFREHHPSIYKKYFSHLTW
uniref:Spermatogenesis-associated protein 18 n=1 Tax=Haemonchus contortus TaxID=6289 RepID=A0A7I5E884_HAECO|nr:Protein C02E7.10 [Haemonchus contortus]